MHIDEHVLAAYMAGELGESDRAIVTSKLVSDESLRNWLDMASQALSAALGEQENGLSMKLLSMHEPLHPGVFNTDRPARAVARKKRFAV
jgi:hypothetical protein